MYRESSQILAEFFLVTGVEIGNKHQSSAQSDQRNVLGLRIEAPDIDEENLGCAHQQQAQSGEPEAALSDQDRKQEHGNTFDSPSYGELASGRFQRDESRKQTKRHKEKYLLRAAVQRRAAGNSRARAPQGEREQKRMVKVVTALQPIRCSNRDQGKRRPSGRHPRILQFEVEQGGKGGCSEVGEERAGLLKLCILWPGAAQPPVGVVIRSGQRKDSRDTRTDLSYHARSLQVHEEDSEETCSKSGVTLPAQKSCIQVEAYFDQNNSEQHPDHGNVERGNFVPDQQSEEDGGSPGVAGGERGPRPRDR